MHRLAEEYPEVELSDMLVDNCAMQIVKNPAQFDVIVTENMFGDILSDEASMITGSIGMIPSDPRLCSRYRRHGRCQSHWNNTFCRYDAPLQL